MSNPVAYTCRQWLDGHPGGLIVRMPHPSFTEPLYDQAGLDAAVAAERERIAALLVGVDKVESEDEAGWWETSTGADFGARILKQVASRV